MKVLVADDSLVMRRLLESMLAGWGYDVVSAKDGSEAWTYLEAENHPQLAILDWMMPDVTGLELCRRVRGLKRSNYTYILLLTSKGLREDMVEGLSAGADDYVVKPFDKHELEVRLRAGRRIIDLQTELMKAQEALREQATHDALTKVFNRASILNILESEVIRAHRERRPLGVVMADLDHFKQVNDVWGHQAGDQALREAARRFLPVMRSYDSVGRYGGEEFLAVIPGCDQSSVQAQAERLRHALEAEPLRLGGQELQLTCSFGATSTVPGEDATVEQIVRAADEALYAAKRNGRNRVEYQATRLALRPARI